MEQFTQELFDEICDRLAHGESLRKICESDWMPYRSSIYRWLEDDATLRDQYARARDQQADYLAEECVDIADEDPATCIKTEGDNEIRVIDSAAVAHQRLRIDARKWFASKVAPKKYGDKLELGSDPARPLMVRQVELLVVDPKASDA